MKISGWLRALSACTRLRGTLPRQTLPVVSRRLMVALAWVTMACATGAVRASPIVLVLSDTAPAYQQFAEAFSTTFGDAASVSVAQAGQTAGVLGADTRLVIAVGSRAADSLDALTPGKALMLAMVPRATYERIRARRPLSGGVLIDQPAARYMQLVRVALPEHGQIGILDGRDSHENTQRLLAAARALGLKARSEEIHDEHDIYPSMLPLLSEGAVLLATPDASIFNARTIPSILLGAFRHNVPVIGFSPSYVNAGAAIALYSSPAQLATQATELAQSVLGGAPHPGMQYPKRFSVGINERVARSLGLRLEDSTVIRERLEKLERQP